MLLAAVPAVSASTSSPNNLKDDAPGMLAGCRRMCTSRSHNGCRHHSDSLVHHASGSAHGAVLAPLVGGGARTTFPVRIRGGQGHGVRLCVVVFVLCRAKTQRQAKDWTILHLWHVGYCRKAFVIVRTHCTDASR
jgi:hypothetical protein